MDRHGCLLHILRMGFHAARQRSASLLPGHCHRIGGGRSSELLHQLQVHLQGRALLGKGCCSQIFPDLGRQFPALDHLLQHAGWLEHIGFKADGIFVFARLAVSLIVSLAWNFLLQKNFVYVYTRFDPFAIKFIDFITPHRKKLKKSNTRQSKADKTH